MGDVRVAACAAGRREIEVARFEEAFDDAVIPKETSRFLADDRHVLLLGYVDDRPRASCPQSRSSIRTNSPSSS